MDDMGGTLVVLRAKRKRRRSEFPPESTYFPRRSKRCLTLLSEKMTVPELEA